MNDHTSQRPMWILVTWWVGGNTLGALLGFGLSFAFVFVAKKIVPGLNEDHLIGLALFPALALGLALMQSIAVRHYVQPASHWLWATLAGWALGFALIAGLAALVVAVTGSGIQPGAPMLILIPLTFGLALGFMQWLVLRHSASRAGWWPVANVVGWVAMLLVIGPTIVNMLEMIAFGAVPALITGIALVWLLRHPISNSSAESQMA